MIAELEYPIKSLKGNIGHEFYTRTLNGKQVIQRRPKRDKPPTEAQIKVRKSFAEKYAGKHSLPRYHSDTTLKRYRRYAQGLPPPNT